MSRNLSFQNCYLTTNRNHFESVLEFDGIASVNYIIDDLDRVSEWPEWNYLVLNPSKSKSLEQKGKS